MMSGLTAGAYFASVGVLAILPLPLSRLAPSLHPDAAITTRSDMEIRLDDLAGVEIRALLAEHLHNMHEHSPPESVHALDLTGLLKAEITFWTVWSGGELFGCGALKELTPAHGEIKSMRTVSAHRRKGVARAMLEHIIGEARRRSYARLSLETGSMGAFEPARRLYERFGFKYCAPFGDYREDPNSVFLTRILEDR
jgi:putative acetyltransferase